EVLEAGACLAYAEGQQDEALEMLSTAALREHADGGESTTVPANEMLADLLLDAQRPTEALAKYEETLRAAPNRFNALAGAIRAAQMGKQPVTARSYYEQLIAIAVPGAQRREWRELRAEMSRPGK